MKCKNGMNLALKEHMLQGNPITRLDAITLFGVSNLTALVSNMRKDGWIICSKKINYVKAQKRLNDFLTFIPPKNLPVREIQLTEYWISK